MLGSIEMSEEYLNPTNIKVVGIGGAGCSAINRMIENGFKGVEFIALNTDVQSINISKAHHKIQIGAQLTKGLGTGANIELGREAALESKDAIKEAIMGSNLLFITAGMGGGTGTGASPIVAEIAKELGILTISFVTYPFIFEGKKRMDQALSGIDRLKSQVDSLISIQNQKLLDTVEDKNLSLVQAFEKVDDILIQGIQGIVDIINKTGIVNVDFADVRIIMNNAGATLMGFGQASGKDRGMTAVKLALNNPLLNVDIKGAGGILVNISSGKTLSLLEYQQIVDFITSKASENANIIAGAFIDESYAEQLCVTVIATHFEKQISEVGTSLVEENIKSTENMVLLNSEKKENLDLLTQEEIPHKPIKEVVYNTNIEDEQIDNISSAITKQDADHSLPFTSRPLLEKRSQQYKNSDLFISRQDTIKVFDEDFQLGKLDLPAFQRKGI